MRTHNVSLYAYSPWRAISVARPCRRDKTQRDAHDARGDRYGCTCMSASSHQGAMRHDVECKSGALPLPSHSCSVTPHVIGAEQPWQTRDNFMRFALLNARVCGFDVGATPPNDGGQLLRW